MEREGQPSPSETVDATIEAQESQPTSPEESVEKVEKPLDGAQAEQMTVELQGELGNTANALLERAKQAGLAEDADVQGLLGEFAQLSEQLGTALENFKAEAAKAEEGAAKIAAAHEAMPDIVGAEQVAKAQAGVEAAQAKVAQGEAARNVLQAEQSRVKDQVNASKVEATPDGEKLESQETTPENIEQQLEMTAEGQAAKDYLEERAQIFEKASQQVGDMTIKAFLKSLAQEVRGEASFYVPTFMDGQESGLSARMTRSRLALETMQANIEGRRTLETYEASTRLSYDDKKALGNVVKAYDDQAYMSIKTNLVKAGKRLEQKIVAEKEVA